MLKVVQTPCSEVPVTNFDFEVSYGDRFETHSVSDQSGNDAAKYGRDLLTVRSRMGSNAIPICHDIPASVLLVVAADVEARAVVAAFDRVPLATSSQLWRTVELDQRWSMLVTGIGKVNAAGALVQALSAPRGYQLVINIGLAGLLPTGRARLEIGQAVVADPSVYADEGVETESAFLECAALGFPMGGSLFAGPQVPVGTRFAGIDATADARGPIATVSTCSGTDARADAVAKRTGAIAEAMEGASCAHVCAVLGVPFAELRVISNTTGDRARQRWDVPRALARMTDLVRSWRQAISV